MDETKTIKQRNPWAWVPTLYFAEGIPYVAVMTISVIMYKRLGISNTDIALYTGWLYLPWVIKPFWSPFVDLVKTKRWWIVVMQMILAIAFACIAFTIPLSFFFQLTLAAFWLVAFTSATHDIAADGYYMHALSDHDQSLFVGIRSTFYRIATIAGQGLLVILAGIIESSSGLQPAELQMNASRDHITASNAAPVQKDDMAFVFTPVQQPTSGPDGKGDALTFVREKNMTNGFVAKEVSKQAAAASPAKDNELTQWLRKTFGETRESVSHAAERSVVVGVRLNKKLQNDDKKILNVAFKSGDQGIVMEQSKLSTRFEFTAKNSDKTAYLLFHIDNKIKKATTATFEGTSGNVPLAWMTVFITLSILFFTVSLYHNWVLPKPASDHPATEVTAGNLMLEFLKTFKTFFTKKNALAAILFMLLYRLPEAQLVKLVNPFLLDPLDKGGLGLTTGQVGIVYGTVGIIGLTIGGILGGIAAARGGLKRWLWPMVCAITLPDLVYVYMAYALPQSLFTINACVFIEQFGYGFGFTAYMLYLIYFSEGEHKTAHYAICTGFMALGMMLPGMAAGWLQETLGYRHFFNWTIICCLATFIVCAFIKIDPNFGKKTKE
jgi:PAT family beta-lactamase induction signal transducer AmpG